MRVLVADKLSPQVLEALQSSGIEVESNPDLTAGDLPGKIAGFNVLVVRSTKVTSATIDAADVLSLIIRAGAGVNTIDVAAANTHGIYVTNCPGLNSVAVAELTIGLLIACDRRIVNATGEMRSGQWNKKEYGKAGGLKGRTLGVLGMGQIGRALVERARGLEMNVIAWSRSLTPDRADALGVQFADSPRSIAKQSDAVSIHLAATPETRKLIDAGFLSTMRDGAILVNTSRGDLVDTAALKDAIRSKHLRVGLDVYENEPGPAKARFEDTELAGMITATPHIAASTDQASEAIASEVLRIITAFRETGRPLNVVNMCARTPATHSLVIRHYNRVGVLAGVLDSLREEDINVSEMENTIFDGADAACCTLQLDQSPSQGLLDNLAGKDNILQVHLEAR